MLALALILIALASAVEMAFSAADRGRIRDLADQGDRRAQRVVALLSDSSHFLITMMVLKTAGLVGAGLALIGMIPNAATPFTLLLIGIALWLATVLIQVLARALTQHHANGFALQSAALVSFLSALVWPVTKLVQTIGLTLGDEETEAADESVFLSEEGLRLLLNVREEEEAIEDSEKQMIASILDMEETFARETMVPRIDIVALNVESSLREALDVIIEAGHSRIPVYEGNVDRVLGFLYAKDLLQAFRDDNMDAPLQSLLRPAYFVPETKTLDTLFSEMQKRRVHIAIVVDEYGGTAGLITIEDILEEIVGEIQDEYDEVEEAYVQTIAPGVYLLNARLDLDDLAELLETDLPDENADTLGGLIYSLLGHVPVPGESVELQDDWRFTVLTIDGRRIEQVRVERIAAPESDGEDVQGEGQPRFSSQGSIFNFLILH
jgi:CBS domain containing-hemolysin-like protein